YQRITALAGCGAARSRGRGPAATTRLGPALDHHRRGGGLRDVLSGGWQRRKKEEEVAAPAESRSVHRTVELSRRTVVADSVRGSPRTPMRHDIHGCAARDGA